MSASRRGLLVGVDGSACSDAALAWAATEAAARHGRLTVAYVLDSPLARGLPVTPSLARVLETDAKEILRRAAAAAGERAPSADVRTLLVDGEDPAAELIRLAGEADEVVVGSRGHGGFAALTLGSVAGHVAAHAPCPAVVVHGHGEHGDGPVVVGVDGSERGEDALAYAFEHAARHGLRVVGLHLYRLALPLVGPYPSLPEELADVQRSAERLAGEAVHRWADKYPDVPLTSAADLGSAIHKLVEASEKASLLVVGSRGHSGIQGLVLGSVSQAVLRHAHCPVAVAR